MRLRGTWIAATAVGFVVLMLLVFSRPLMTHHKLRVLDQVMSDAYMSYTDESFTVATNKLVEYISFLEKNETELQGVRDVDGLLYLARVKLGYMYLHLGRADPAFAEFSLAYERYSRLLVPAGVTFVPRTDFVAYVIRGIEELDAKTNVAWKAEVELGTNVIDTVNAMFISNRITEPMLSP